VLSNKERIQFFIHNNTFIIVELLTNANLLDNHSKAVESEDSLFLYKESLKHLHPMHETHDVGGMLDYHHNVGSIYPNGS